LSAIKFSTYKKGKVNMAHRPSTLPWCCTGKVKVKLNTFKKTTSECNGWSASHTSLFTPDTHWIGDLVGFRAYLDMKPKRKMYFSQLCECT
jgi:hypothetical protein